MKEITIQGHRYAVRKYNAEFQLSSNKALLRMFQEEHPESKTMTNAEMEKAFNAWSKEVQALGQDSPELERLERDMIFAPLNGAPRISQLFQDCSLTTEELGEVMMAIAFFAQSVPGNITQHATSSTPSTGKKPALDRFGKRKGSQSPRKTIRKPRG